MPLYDVITPVINPLLNLSELRAEFADNQILIIEDWIDAATAESLWRFLDHEMPSCWLHGASLPLLKAKKGQAKRYSCNYARNIPKNTRYIQTCFDLAHRGLNEGKFSYFMWRSFEDHSSDCKCKECQFREFLRTDAVMDFLSKITGSKLSVLRTAFAAVYDKGCFVSAHTDDGNGKLAYVFHLSRDWNPCWGGMYVALDSSLKKITRAIMPRFNQLTIFPVGTPHLVTEVGRSIARKRLSISGWYE